MVASPLPEATETAPVFTKTKKDNENMATRRAQPALPPEAENEKAPKPAKKAAAKATKTKSVKEMDINGTVVKKARRVMGDRNWLAREIDGVIRNANGPVTVRDIVTAINDKEGEHPSSGAVAAALKRWSEEGYINVTLSPLAFKSFPAKHKNGTLDSFLEKSRETRLAERRAAREAVA